MQSTIAGAVPRPLTIEFWQANICGATYDHGECLLCGKYTAKEGMLCEECYGAYQLQSRYKDTDLSNESIGELVNWVNGEYEKLHQPPERTHYNGYVIIGRCRE
jgi:hypothetical protein